MQVRRASDDGAASLPFSHGYNSNDLPRLPSPSHGDVACLDATLSLLADVEGARSIRDWETTKMLSANAYI